MRRVLLFVVGGRAEEEWKREKGDNRVKRFELEI